MCAKVEDGLIAPEARVRAGRLSGPAKIGAAADRILRDSGVGRCFKTTVRKGVFSWDFDEKARCYDEELLCGRYVITTSLDKSGPEVQLISDPFVVSGVEVRLRVRVVPQAVVIEPWGAAVSFEFDGLYMTCRVSVPDGHTMLVIR